MAKPKKRKDGRYQRSVLLSNGRRKVVYGRTLAELQAAEDALKAEDRSGVEVGDDTTVGEWAAIWLHSYKNDLRVKTVNMYRSAYNNHILGVIGGMELRDVRPVHIRTVMAGVADKSQSLQHKVLITLRQLFNTARQNGLLLRDPTEGIKTTPHTTPEKKKYLTLAELEALLQGIEDPRAKVFAALCGYAGLRKEEALGLRWSDIGEGRIIIRRAVTHIGNRPDPDMSLKTKASARTVPIPAPLQEILDRTPRLGTHVVCCQDGGILTASGYKRLWGHVQAASPQPIHAHMLRHTYATSLYKAGVDIRTAQKLLGHTSIQMTANIYTHLEAEDALDALDTINGYFARVAVANTEQDVSASPAV